MEWISIKDELPERNQTVLVHMVCHYTDDDGNEIKVMPRVAWFYEEIDDGIEFICNITGECLENVTHWQPITPPNET